MSPSKLTIRVRVDAFEHPENGTMVESINQEGKEFLALLDLLFPGFLVEFTLVRFSPNPCSLLDLIRQYINKRKGLGVSRYYEAPSDKEGTDWVSLTVDESDCPEIFHKAIQAMYQK